MANQQPQSSQNMTADEFARVVFGGASAHLSPADAVAGSREISGHSTINGGSAVRDAGAAAIISAITGHGKGA